MPHATPSVDPEELLMLVDDDTDTREMFALCLEEAGYKVVQAGDGIEAMALLQRVSPVAVITDLCMPHMSGLALAAMMKRTAHLADIPIGLISATPPHHGAAGLALFAQILAKPCSWSDLVDLASALVLHHRRFAVHRQRAGSSAAEA